MSESREHLYTQKLYPTVNNADLLEFRIPPNPKGQIDLSNVKLHFNATMPSPSDGGTAAYPQNFFGAKQFSSLEVRVNGEAVTRRSCANEYFLAAYFQTMINFTADYQTTALKPAGVFDHSSMSTSEIAALAGSQKLAFKDSRTQVQYSKDLEILMPIDSTIFYSSNILPSNTPIDLSFERAGASFSTIFSKTGSTAAEKGASLIFTFFPKNLRIVA